MHVQQCTEVTLVNSFHTPYTTCMSIEEQESINTNTSKLTRTLRIRNNSCSSNTVFTFEDKLLLSQSVSIPSTYRNEFGNRESLMQLYQFQRLWVRSSPRPLRFIADCRALYHKCKHLLFPPKVDGISTICPLAVTSQWEVRLFDIQFVVVWWSNNNQCNL